VAGGRSCEWCGREASAEAHPFTWRRDCTDLEPQLCRTCSRLLAPDLYTNDLHDGFDVLALAQFAVCDRLAELFASGEASPDRCWWCRRPGAPVEHSSWLGDALLFAEPVLCEVCVGLTGLVGGGFADVDEEGRAAREQAFETLADASEPPIAGLRERADELVLAKLALVSVGSQAILGAFPDAPQTMLTSVEADVFPRNHPELADEVDVAIGELSSFHETFGYYAHGVGPETVTAPRGWGERLVPVVGEQLEGATGWCLEPHDLVAAKMTAGREKDWHFIEEALRHRLVRPEILRERLHELPLPSERCDELARLLDGRLAQTARREAQSVAGTASSAQRVWVRPHKRGGGTVSGYWRGGR
jgi:hypothetical protein